MTGQQKFERLFLKIQETANLNHCLDEDGDGYDPCGNYDDYFDDGKVLGEIEFARELLRLITDKQEDN